MEMKTGHMRRMGEAHESLTDRQERLLGWRQERMEQARVLILGAGALGNEVAKNLALMGVGYMMVADMDEVSWSNLSRAVFFRRSDARKKRLKADLVAGRARAMNVADRAYTQVFHGDIVWQLGGGVFRRVDVVLGCLDNVEARLHANTLCIYTETPYIDGGIAGLAGNVTAVNPPYTACWACTTSAAERNAARSRYDSCSLVMRRDLAAGRLPTVQVASSIIAGFQTQEAVKVIQRRPWAAGTLLMYTANGARPDVDIVTISRSPECWCSEAKTFETIVELPLQAAEHTLRDVCSALAARGYDNVQVMFPGRFITTRICMACHYRDEMMCPVFTLDTQALSCRQCGAYADQIELEYVETTRPEAFVDLEQGMQVRERLFTLTLAQLGFPPLALLSFSAGGQDESFAYVAELSADALQVMGSAEYTSVCKRTGEVR